MEKFEFFYDESEHSRKINYDTITQDNYYDGFTTFTVGWNIDNANFITKKYKEFEEKYRDRKSKGELKSSTIKNMQIKDGFASLSSDNIEFLKNFFNIFDEKLYICFSVESKIEYVIIQIFEHYDLKYYLDFKAMVYAIVKVIMKYNPKKVVESMYKNSDEFIMNLKEFLKDRISANMLNENLKQRENKAFTQLLFILESDIEPFEMNWNYERAFFGFNNYVNEMKIHNYSLIIDKEGEESQTLKTAKSIGLKNVREEDSKNCCGIRIADMLAGLFTKLLKSVKSNLEYSSVEDGINKKLLGKEWFVLDSEKLNLYKDFYYIISELNNAYWKSISGVYKDNFIALITLLEYMNSFETILEFEKIGIDSHQENFNTLVIEKLSYCFDEI